METFHTLSVPLVSNGLDWSCCNYTGTFVALAQNLFIVGLAWYVTSHQPSPLCLGHAILGTKVYSR